MYLAYPDLLTDVFQSRSRVSWERALGTMVVVAFVLSFQSRSRVSWERAEFLGLWQRTDLVCFNPVAGFPGSAPLNLNPPSIAVKRQHALPIGPGCGPSAVVD